MAPPRLHDGDPLREVRQRRPQEVPARDEVGVEDRDELAARRGESLGECPGLVSRPLRSAAVRYPNALRAQLGDNASDVLRGVALRAVELLDPETTHRICR